MGFLLTLVAAIGGLWFLHTQIKTKKDRAERSTAFFRTVEQVFETTMLGKKEYWAFMLVSMEEDKYLHYTPAMIDNLLDDPQQVFNNFTDDKLKVCSKHSIAEFGSYMDELGNEYIENFVPGSEDLSNNFDLFIKLRDKLLTKARDLRVRDGIPCAYDT